MADRTRLMAKRRQPAAEDVLAEIARSHQPLSLRELAVALELPPRSQQELKKALKRLVRDGAVAERHGRYSLTGSHAAAGPGAAKPSGARKPRHPSAPAPLPAPHGRESPANARAILTGRLVAHRDGYGFVVPDRPVAGVDGDLFIPPPAMGDAMHGDRVEARVTRRAHDGRAEGCILRVLSRAHPTIVGEFRYGARGNYVIPFDTRVRQEIVIPPGAELTEALRRRLGVKPGEPPPRLRLPELENKVVNVELTRYPRGGVPAAGRVVEILGDRDAFGVDVEIIIRKHHLPFVFPEEVQDAARRVPQQVRPQDFEGREDFRHLPTVTIDGESAKDFDDAVYVERLPGGNYQLQVHIADVAHYVARGSALDREARLRGTSVYFPDRAVPMLPEALSNGICSLNPQVDRLVMSVVMEVNGQGQVVHARFVPGVIRSRERMTYTNVNRVLEGDPKMRRQYAPLVEQFVLMRELALCLHRRRAALGSIDFDLPEPVIEFDELGRMVRIVRSERNMAHRIIEEFMLAANETVARYLHRRGLASLHRVHEKPDPQKLLEFEELAAAFGYSLGVPDLVERRRTVRHGTVRGPRRGSRERPMTVAVAAADQWNVSPKLYQRLVEKIAGKPEERILSYLMLRSLKQARYAVEPLGHFALAFDHYTHFTSPIRRYPDLIVHRILKWALAHPEARGGEAPLGPYQRVELEEIAAESSEAERRAEAAERELMEWKTARYMEQRLGEEFDALVISVQRFGMFVELLDIFVEGLVPMPAIEVAVGERCFYRERDHAIVTPRRQPVFRLGDRVRVRADRIDYFQMRTEFSLVTREGGQHSTPARRRHGR
ncbi:MAG: VacB/RNase II family 3'-5' exoribonuclease [Firmicutes bacterium]|nr:VacB/RNase II family 3'-5' exoribonuclease [Bacillota bacterium]